LRQKDQAPLAGGTAISLFVRAGVIFDLYINLLTRSDIELYFYVILDLG
jgi:hypothetical protein